MIKFTSLERHLLSAFSPSRCLPTSRPLIMPRSSSSRPHFISGTSGSSSSSIPLQHLTCQRNANSFQSNSPPGKITPQSQWQQQRQQRQANPNLQHHLLLSVPSLPSRRELRKRFSSPEFSLLDYTFHLSLWPFLLIPPPPNKSISITIKCDDDSLYTHGNHNENNLCVCVLPTRCHQKHLVIAPKMNCRETNLP